jgi:hypothetical protein
MSSNHSTRAAHQSRGGRINHAGLWLAALAGTAGVLVVVLSWQGLGKPSQQPGAGRTVSPAPQPDLIDVPSGKSNRALRNLGKGEELFVQMADKSDPTRIAGQLSAARSTPLEGKRYKMEMPRVWSFLRDGRTIYLEADSGQALIPDMTGSRPEDGAIQGNVVAKVFPKTADGSLPDPAKAMPQLTLRSQELRFDLRSGEFRFPGEVTLTGPRIDFAGSDVLVLVDDVSQRLELLKVEKTTRCVLTPGAEVPGQAAAGESRPTPAVRVVMASYSHPAPPPVETFFDLQLRGAVSIVQGTRSLASDALLGYVRLVNNELRPGAVSGGAMKKSGMAPGQGRSGGPAIINAAYQPPAPASAGKPAKPDEPIVMAWTGPMELKSIKTAPAELARDDMFVRATSKEDGGVVVRDQEQKVSATGRMLQYFTTTQAAAIEGSEANPARLEREGAGQAQAMRFDVDPTAGKVTAEGEGSLTGAVTSKGAARKPDMLTWKTGAQFTFGLDNGTMSSRLSSIALRGDVKAGSGSTGGGLSGESLDAEFTAINAANSYLSRVLVKGKARAWDDKDGVLEAKELDVALMQVQGASQSQPVSLKAAGEVKASQQDSKLEAAALEVSLEQQRKDDGRFSTVVAKAVANGDVRFERADGVKAGTSLLTAMPLEQSVTLSGPGSWVGQFKTAIKGNTIAMHGVKRTLAVEGPGEFVHEQEARGEKLASTAHVSWSKGMTFDDAAGLVTCTGSAQAVMTRGVLERDTIGAQSVQVALGPAAKKEDAKQAGEEAGSKPAKVGSGPDLGIAGSDRPLLWALATGEQVPASIEMKRFDAADPKSVVKLMYLEGGSIRADNTTGQLDVPGKGKLLTMDRERAKEPAAAPGTMDSRLAGDSKGTALFAWDGSLKFDRSAGTAVLVDGVSVTHKALADGLVTQLRCAQLTARLESAAAGETQMISGGLRSAEATGAVWLASRDSEMVAQWLSFDAVTRIVDAKGGAGVGDLVTVTGQNGAAPLSAQEIIWNLGENTFRLIGAQPVTAPR